VNTLRSIFLGLALGVMALASYASTASKDGAATAASPSKSVQEVRTGDIVITTKDRVSLHGLESSVCKGINPQKPDEPEDPEKPLTYQYKYSFMLVNGTVRLDRDGTLTLEEGELCVSAETVQGLPEEGYCACADRIPTILYLFPLVKTKSTQSGSVSTEYIVRSPPGNAPVEVALRSGPGHKVWVAQYANVCSCSVDLVLEATTKMAQTKEEDGRNVIKEVPVDDSKEARLKVLDGLAVDMGIFKPREKN